MTVDASVIEMHALSFPLGLDPAGDATRWFLYW